MIDLSCQEQSVFYASVQFVLHVISVPIARTNVDICFGKVGIILNLYKFKFCFFCGSYIPRLRPKEIIGLG